MDIYFCVYICYLNMCNDPPNVLSWQYVTYKNPSESLCVSYSPPISVVIGYILLLMNINRALSAGNRTRLRIIC